MDNAILSFPGFVRLALAFHRKSNDLLRQISIAELVARGSRQPLCNNRIGRSYRYDRRAYAAGVPDTSLSNSAGLFAVVLHLQT